MVVIATLMGHPAAGAVNSNDSIDYFFQLERKAIAQKDVDSALYYQNKLENLVLATHDCQKLITAYKMFGHLLEERGSFEKSLQLYQKGIEIARSYEDAVSEAQMLIDISQAYRIFHDYDKAALYGKEAMHVLEQDTTDNLLVMVEAMSIVAAAFTEMGVPDSSIKYHEAAIAYLPELDSTHLKANMINLGYTYMELGMLEECKFWTERGLELYKPTRDAYSLGSIYTNLAMYGNRANELDYALTMFDSAIYYTEKSQYIETLFWIYEERAQVYQKLGKYDLAIRDMEALVQVKDSVFKAQRDNTIQEMDAKYQTERREQQIANQKLLIAEEQAVNQRNVIFIIALAVTLALVLVVITLYRSRVEKKHQITLQQKDMEAQAMQLNAALSSQENERKRFATDLHDGFGQMISILKMNIQSLQDRNPDHTERLQAYNKSKEMLDEMYDELRGICFNLMPQTLVRNGLIEALQEFASRINAAGKISVEVLSFGMDQRLEDLHEISIYRVIQEWVNNILKYGTATNVTIQLTRDQTELTLTIEDDGQGFDPALLLESKGNGWKNIQSRANLVVGQVELDTRDGQQGSTFILNVPMTSNREERAAPTRASTDK